MHLEKEAKRVNNEHHDTRVLHTGRIIYMSTANLYSQKTQKIQFLPVIELMSDSLTAIKVYVDRKKIGHVFFFTHCVMLTFLLNYDEEREALVIRSTR